MESNEINLAEILILLKEESVSCGFPFQGQDYVEKRLNLNEFIKHPATSLMIRAGGDSLIERLIDDGTYLIYDRMIVNPKHGDLAYVVINGEECVREIFYDQDGKLFLIARNPNYSPIEVTEEMDFRIKGKIILSITKQ
jgi:DNA polymerase V